MRILAVLLILLSFKSFAECTHFEPYSVVEPLTRGIPTPGPSCKEAPEEKCFCVEGIIWDYAEIVDGELVNSETKKARVETERLNKESVRKAKEAKIATAKEALKNADIEGATTIAKLKVILKLLIDSQE